MTSLRSTYESHQECDLILFWRISFHYSCFLRALASDLLEESVAVASVVIVSVMMFACWMQPVIILKKRGDYSLEANFGPEVNFVSALMKAAHTTMQSQRPITSIEAQLPPPQHLSSLKTRHNFEGVNAASMLLLKSSRLWLAGRQFRRWGKACWWSGVNSANCR